MFEALPAFEPAPFEAGMVLAKKYRLDRPAGFGGMAELWVATNQATGGEVCIKLLSVRGGGGERGTAADEVVERFRREAYAAANLSHRAIVSAFDLLELDADGETTSDAPHAYGIVMELLRGETLGDLLAKRGKLPVEEALDLFLPVVSALAHAHRASVIHRDIKPDNVFLAQDPDGQVIPKILDFGVSKLETNEAITIDGVLVGTPSFMSPEQAKGARHVDARSDVFSAGLLFYMMLDGANPFENASFASVVDAILRREVPRLEGVPPPIWDVLERALAKDPALRWPDATEMGIALRKASGRRATTESSPVLPLAPISSRSVPVDAEPEPEVDLPAGPSLEGRSRRRAIVAGAVGLALALLVVAAVMTTMRSPSAAKPVGAATATAATTAPALAGEPSTTTAAVEGTPASAIPAEPASPVTANAKPSVRALPPRPPPRPAPPVTTGRKPGEEPNKARDPGF